MYGVSSTALVMDGSRASPVPCSCDVLLQCITGTAGGRTTDPAGALHQGTLFSSSQLFSFPKK